jgi:glutamine amidotransferase
MTAASTADGDRPAAPGGPIIAVLDYGIGNLRSAEKALLHVGADARLTSDPGLVAEADGVVLPGVGAFGACMSALRSAGLADVAHEAAAGPRPFLGVCVGMQMLFEGSDESPNATGLGVVQGRVRLLPDDVKRPQMQWNRLDVRRATPLLRPNAEHWMYFVHSYAAECDESLVTATCRYGTDVVAVVEQGTCWATQFHPEKSSSAGHDLLRSFVRLVAASSEEAARP